MAKTRTPRKKATGLGDTVEQVLEATGIAKVAKFVLGEDCNCDERKKKLNEWFPYRKPECLTEEEYNWLTETRILEQETFKPSEVTRIREIYSRVMKVRLEPSSCASCFREIVFNLKKIYDAYTETTTEGAE
jgi:hypothetical protein